MGEVDFFDSIQVGNVIHDKAISRSLWLHPGFRFQADMAADSIKEFPCV
jgi:hypothetical protein